MGLLWGELPAESRTVRRRNPAKQWTDAEYLLWRIEYHFRALRWGLADKKDRPSAEPRPLETPGQVAEAYRRRDAALAARSEIDEILGMDGDGDG